MARQKKRTGGKGAKRKAELEARIKDYEVTIKKLSPKQASAYRKPGSMTGRQ